MSWILNHLYIDTLIFKTFDAHQTSSAFAVEVFNLKKAENFKDLKVGESVCP